VALLYSAISHSNLGEAAASDSLVRILATKQEQLSDYDREWVEYLQAQLAGDHDAALRAIRRAAEMAPGSKAAYNEAYVALQTNRPGAALAALRTLDPERGAMRGWFQYWKLLTDAHHRRGEHDQELTAARKARALYPDRITALAYEAEALAALGRVRDLEQVLAEVQARGGDEVDPNQLMVNVGEELRTHGNAVASSAMFTRALDSLSHQPASEQAMPVAQGIAATALEQLGRVAEADSVVRLMAAHSADTSIVLRGWLGYLAARQGDRARAMAFASELDKSRGPYLYGASSFAYARIAAVLGDTAVAIEKLREAFARGYPHPRHLDRNFDVLHGVPAFADLLKPRD
jgi:tetratricopeptide (TPR) repeat protein